MPQSKSLVYLAGPYSHPDPYVRLSRFHALNRIAARLMAQPHGLFIFSPISHTHPIAVSGCLPTGFDYWERYDRAILECCRKMIVVKLPGWEKSVGVKAEIRIAGELGIPVEYMEVGNDAE